MSSKIIDDVYRMEGSIYNATQVNAGGSPALNLNLGGLMGAMPRFGYRDPSSKRHYGEWLNATPYVRENVIPVLLSYPKFFDLLPNSEEWIGMLKAIMEVQAQSIDGLRSTISVASDTVAASGAGDEFGVPVNVTKERSQPAYQFKERMGRPYTKFFNMWVEYGIMDPYTKRAKALRYLDQDPSRTEGKTDLDELNATFGMWTPEWYTCSVLYIEPSNQFTTVEKAWLCFNMYPDGQLGAVEGRRDITTNKDTLDVSITFQAITIDNDAVIVLAKSLLPRLVSLWEISDMELTLPIVAADPKITDNKYSHSADAPKQGNGPLSNEGLEWDTHPKA